MKIDILNAPTRLGSAYPSPHDEPCRERKRIRLGVGTDDSQDRAAYPDIDMRMTLDGFVHKDGTPYPAAGQK